MPHEGHAGRGFRADMVPMWPRGQLPSAAPACFGGRVLGWGSLAWQQCTPEGRSAAHATCEGGDKTRVLDILYLGWVEGFRI